MFNRKSFRKYWFSAVVSLKGDTVYIASVLSWRVRSVLRVLVVYVLWSSLLLGYGSVSHYSRTTLLSYVLLTMIVQAVVFSSRTIDISNDISSGDLTNILLKPVNYFKYYLAQDLGNKAMNLVFSIVEFSLFIYFFKPTLFLQPNLVLLGVSILLLILAGFIYYFLNIILGFLAFYNPENVWAPRFLFFMIVDFLAGSLFPLDILPPMFFKLLMLTPFPYFLYFPISVYLGKFTGGSLVLYSFIGLMWLFVLSRLAVILWRLGLKAYEAWGR